MSDELEETHDHQNSGTPSERGATFNLQLDPAALLNALRSWAEQAELTPNRVLFGGMFLSVMAMALAVFGHGDPTLQRITIVCILLWWALALFLLLRAERRRRRLSKPAGTRFARTSIAVLVAATIAIASSVFWQTGAVAATFPNYFPANAAERALEEHFLSLDRFLRSDKAGMTRAFEDVAATMTEDFATRNLPPKAMETMAEAPRSGQLANIAGEYRNRFGRIDGLTVEAVRHESWRPIVKRENRESTYVFAVVRYTGRFISNPWPDKRLTFASLDLALIQGKSPERAEMSEWLGRVFPLADHDQIWNALRTIRLEDWGKGNLVDLITFNQPGIAGIPSDNEYRFGEELTFVSARMEREQGERWRVAELGKWMVRRFFTDDNRVQSTPHDIFTSLATPPQYIAQHSDGLCQSAVLEMLYSHCAHKEYPGGQEAIRNELGIGTEGLGHDARKRWLDHSVPSIGWKLYYEESLSEAAEKIETSIRRGVPVALSTRLTREGHVVLVTGLRRNPDGTVWLVLHDPWGQFEFSKRQYLRGEDVGKDVRYPLSELYVMNRKWRGPDGKECWSHFLTAAEEWEPSVSNLTATGHQIVETRKDWEWLGPNLD